jgi:hypothetical protein
MWRSPGTPSSKLYSQGLGVSLPLSGRLRLEDGIRGSLAIPFRKLAFTSRNDRVRSRLAYCNRIADQTKKALLAPGGTEGFVALPICQS